MVNEKMMETFEQTTRVPVDYTYAVFAFIAVGLVGYLLVTTFKDAWHRFQNDELRMNEFLTVLTRSIILFMFMLIVFGGS
jgi:hypothetical protein